MQRCHIIFIAKYYNSFGREKNVYPKRYYLGQALNIALTFLAPLCFVIFKLLGIMVEFMIAVSTETNRVDVIKNSQVSCTKLGTQVCDPDSIFFIDVFDVDFRKTRLQDQLWRRLNNQSLKVRKRETFPP